MLIRSTLIKLEVLGVHGCQCLAAKGYLQLVPAAAPSFQSGAASYAVFAQLQRGPPHGPASPPYYATLELRNKQYHNGILDLDGL